MMPGTSVILILVVATLASAVPRPQNNVDFAEMPLGGSTRQAMYEPPPPPATATSPMSEALVMATRAQDWDEIKRLLPRVQDLNGALDAGLLTASAGANRNDVLFYLLDTRNVDPNLRVAGGDQKTALMFAIEGSNFEGAERLLDSGAEPDLLDSGNWTSLHYAAKAGDAVITRRLMALVDPRAVTIDGNTALHYAAQYRNAEAIDALCSGNNGPTGAAEKPTRINVNAHNELSQTPLRLGCCEDVGVLTVLLERCGADPDETDYLNRTPLHYAAKEGTVGAVRLLVAAGANPGVVDDMQETPRFMAKRENHQEIAKILRAAEKQYEMAKTVSTSSTSTSTPAPPTDDYVPEEDVEEEPEEDNDDDFEEPEEETAEEPETNNHIQPGPKAKDEDHQHGRVEPKRPAKKKKEDEFYSWIQYFAPFLLG